MAATPKTAKIKNVVDNPGALGNTGKNRPIRKFAIHKQNTVTPIPIPRSFSGNISESISQVIGEIAPRWKAVKVTFNASGCGPLSPPVF